MNIVICGSMSASNAMMNVARSLEEQGHIAVLPSNIQDHIKGNQMEDAEEKKQFDVFRDYYTKIGEGDAILVVNIPKNGTENYIGPNTLIEMAFAYVLGKPIYLLHEKPVSDFSQEIEAMNPIELFGALDSL